jgi:hypothetical protein
MPNGKFVKEYEYSQGEFSMNDTESVLAAHDFTGRLYSFDTHFKHREAVLEKYRIEVEYEMVPRTYGVRAWTHNPTDRKDEWYLAEFFDVVAENENEAVNLVKKQCEEKNQYFRLCRVQQLT